VANALNNLGLLSLSDRDHAEAERLFEEALAVGRELTDSFGTATALANLGTIARLRGERERARSLLVEGLTLAHDLGDRFVTVHYLLQLGLLATSDGDAGRGVLLVSAAHHLFEDLVHSHRITDAEGYAEAMAAARGALGDAAFERAWAAARSLPLARVVAQALAAEADAVSRPAS
jgi:tetratricopeptide (TPR) repeat protein